jgi:DNA-binding NarL/FixJ family response regulator
MERAGAYRLLLVEDHQIMREGIKTLLERTGEIIVIGEAQTGAEAIRMCRELQPDLVLMDVGLPDLNGVEATRELLRQYPQTGVVILSMYDDEDTVISSVRAGARGYVVKRASSGELLEALRAVARGGSYLSPDVSNRLLSRIRQGEPEALRQSAAAPHLTGRELQVLRLVVSGKSNKEVAATLDIGVETVRSYRKSLMKKLKVKNVAGLIQAAVSAGLAGGAYQFDRK